MAAAAVVVLWASAVAAAAAFLIVHRARWHTWWFELEDPRPLGAFRIVFGLVCLLDVAFMVPELELVVSTNGFGVLSPGATAALAGVFFTAGVAFVVGWHTRSAAFVMFVSMNVIFAHATLMRHSGDLLCSTFLACLVVSRCGEAYSVDAWRRGQPARAVPAWPRRLGMVLTAAFYLESGLYKTDQTEWIDGTAVHYFINYDSIARTRWQGFSVVAADVLPWASRATLWIEILFVLAFVGAVAHWASARRFRSLSPRARSTAAWALAWVIVASLLAYAAWPSAPGFQQRALAAGAAGMLFAAIAWAWRRGHRAMLLRTVLAPRWTIALVVLLQAGILVFINFGALNLASAAICLTYVEPRAGVAQLAYTPRRRRAVGALLAAQLGAWLLWWSPSVPGFENERAAGRAIVRPWFDLTRTATAFRIPGSIPTTNLYLQVIGVAADGRAIDLRTDIYVPEQRPAFAVGNSRTQKIRRRIIGSREFQVRLAQHVCEAPEHRLLSVEIRKLGYPTASPQELRGLGPYDPLDRFARIGRSVVLLRHSCTANG